MGNRAKGEPPAYRRWRRRGTVIGYATDGRRRVKFPGPADSPQSRAAYEAWRAEWVRAHPGEAPRPAGGRVEHLIEAFLRHAREHYRRPDGTPTSEKANYVVPLRVLNELYGERSANDFGPRDLERVRDALVRRPVTRTLADGAVKVLRVGLSRGVVNQYVGRLQRVFAWGKRRGMVRPETAAALRDLEPLEKGRSPARETKRVLPVPWEDVRATLRRMTSRQLKAMVLLQWWCGCRPGQAARVRGCDVHRSGVVLLGRTGIRVPEGVWLYVVPAKMAHLREPDEEDEIYFLGPRAQAVLGPWLRADPAEYLFQPAEAECERLARMRKARKSKVQPSQVSRAKRVKKKRPGPCYDVVSYAHALRRASRAAGVADWHAHRLRHSAYVRFQVRGGLGAYGAGMLCNHRLPGLAHTYGERDVAACADIARRLG